MLHINHILQLLLFLTSLLALIVGFSTYRRSRVHGAMEFSFLMFAIAWWGLCDASQAWFHSEMIKLRFAQASYFGIVISPLAWVGFIFNYSQIKLRIPAWFRYFVYLFCGLFLLVVLSNDLHHLVYKSWFINPGDYGLQFNYGPFFWLWVAVSYFCLMAGTIRLIMTAIRSVTLLRANMILIIVGALFPWIGNIMYISGLNPINGFDPTPVGFVITGTIGMIVIFRKKLFNYVPLAYQNLFINLNDAALVVDYRGNIIESNIRARRLAGRKDLKNYSWSDFCFAFKENPENALLHYLNFQGDEGDELELSVHKADRINWFVLKGSRIGQTEESNRGYIISLRDNTLWKKQKDTLEKSASLMGLSGRFAGEMLRSNDWQSIYREYAPNFQSICKAQGCFISCNPEDESYFAGVLTKESRVWQRTWKNLLKSYLLETPSSDYFELSNDSFLALPLEVDDKKIGYWVFFWKLADKKDALEAHDVLKLASNVLSSAIENQINEVNLRKARDEAEQASRAKSEFLSIMSHEIRTPLNAVIGISHLLKDENKDQSLQEKVDTLNGSAENLLILINDILDYSKIEAGKIELQIQNFSPGYLLKTLLQENEYRARENQNELVFHSSIDENSVYEGDKMRLGQVLNNLLSNALKFTDNGKVEAGIEVLDSKKGVDILKFWVKDTGIGIKAEFMPKLFDMFTQATSTSTRKFGGTGLGLAISQSLLQLMGSKLEVDSKEGIGSTFYFALKLKRASIELKTEKEKNRVKAANDIQGMKVLIVEDNMVNVFVCQNFLKKWGVVSEVAENGEAGVEMIKSNSYDCVLMDIQMPVMDGYEATAKIREFNKEIPIIALTASAMLDKKEKTLMVGMNDFVSKPFRPDELHAVISKYKPA
ncbi:MAG: response regulator [Bacteroidetes bacterium]|nr:response regulator [Bacteroidota bacterium]